MLLFEKALMMFLLMQYKYMQYTRSIFLKMTNETIIVPVILCGDSGDRLCPVSHKLHPKWFLLLNSDKKMFQAAIE